MKASVMAIGLVSLASAAQGAAVLQYQWNFNETGTTAPSTVPGGGTANLSLVNSGNSPTDLHGGPGSGPSGAAGDRALDNSASVSMGGTGGLGRSGSFTSSVGLASSFTATAWINPSNTITGFGRILILGPGGTTDSGSLNSIGLLTTNQASADGTSVGTGTGIQFNISGFSRFPTLSLPQNTWTFVAVSYDDSTDTVRFYTGTTATAATLVYTSTSFTQAAPDLDGAGTTSAALIGNRDNLGRAFDGSIDDVRFYTGLFESTAAVDAVRSSAVPEPTAAGLLLASALMFGRRRRK